MSLEQNVFLGNKVSIGKKEATHGVNCTIACGVTIGDYAFIDARDAINKGFKSYTLMEGVRVKQLDWMSQYDEKLYLPLEVETETICPHTGQLYRLIESKLE